VKQDFVGNSFFVGGSALLCRPTPLGTWVEMPGEQDGALNKAPDEDKIAAALTKAMEMMVYPSVRKSVHDNQYSVDLPADGKTIPAWAVLRVLNLAHPDFVPNGSKRPLQSTSAQLKKKVLSAWIEAEHGLGAVPLASSPNVLELAQGAQVADPVKSTNAAAKNKTPASGANKQSSKAEKRPQLEGEMLQQIFARSKKKKALFGFASANTHYYSNRLKSSGDTSCQRSFFRIISLLPPLSCLLSPASFLLPHPLLSPASCLLPPLSSLL